MTTPGEAHERRIEMERAHPIVDETMPGPPDNAIEETAAVEVTIIHAVANLIEEHGYSRADIERLVNDAIKEAGA